MPSAIIVGSGPSAVSVALCLADEADWKITVLDIGQGDSILLRAGNRVVLIDGGPAGGETKLLPMLADRGIRHIDVVVLTHAHPDHCNGLPAVLDQLDVGAIWINPHRFRGECAQQILAATLRNETPIHIVRDGDRLALGAIHLTAFLSRTNFKRAPENNSSIVLRAQIESKRALLTGDAEREWESELATRNIRCDVLKVGHHGSRTSTTDALLDAARPRVAVISCGRHNLFGHPHASVIESLAKRHIATWRTDIGHSVTIHIIGRQLYASCEIDTSK